MKHRYTLERKRDHEEFVYMHREELAKLIDLPLRDEKLRKWVRTVARPHLGYSCSTIDIDVWLQVHHTYKRIIEDGN